MERKAPLSPISRNKNAPKAPESGTPRVGNQFGKDEVSSSNLDSSSKKLPKSVDFRSFYSIFHQNNVGRKVGQAS